MSSNYLFTSERLGFRNWEPSDLPEMAKISSDEKVMEFFPYVATFEQTKAFIERMRDLLDRKGYCYFAVEELGTKNFIGFIGLCDQEFAVEFSPFTDIGWRLSTEFWNKGYATEGAKRCLEYSFKEIGLKTILSTAPKVNTKSISVMEKIGMEKWLEFDHPRLNNSADLKECVCYRIESNSYLYND